MLAALLKGRSIEESVDVSQVNDKKPASNQIQFHLPFISEQHLS